VFLFHKVKEIWKRPKETPQTVKELNQTVFKRKSAALLRQFTHIFKRKTTLTIMR